MNVEASTALLRLDSVCDRLGNVDLEHAALGYKSLANRFVEIAEQDNTDGGFSALTRRLDAMTVEAHRILELAAP